VVSGGEIEMVKDFIYLCMYVGSKLSCDGEITTEAFCHVAKASKAFGFLRAPI